MRWAILFTGLLTGCLVEVSYEGTAFQCAASAECPPGFSCMDQRCRSGSPPDAAPPDADLSACPDPDGDAEVTALRAPAPLAIDGAIEAAWDGARVVEFTNPGRSDNTARVRLLWDDTNLYFLFEIVDGSLEAASATGQIFLDDGSEFYLDMAHDETDAINADDVHYIANYLEVVQSGTLATAAELTADGYRIEHALAWSETDRTPATGATLGLLLGNNDRDNDLSEQFDWLGLIDRGTGLYTRPNLWGDLHLSDAAAGGVCQ